jgi:hypothetical protein
MPTWTPCPLRRPQQADNVFRPGVGTVGAPAAATSRYGLAWAWFTWSSATSTLIIRRPRRCAGTAGRKPPRLASHLEDGRLRSHRGHKACDSRMTAPAIQPESSGLPTGPALRQSGPKGERQMNLAISSGRGLLRPARLRRALLPAAVIGGVMLAAGCGSGPRHTAVDGGGQTPHERALAIAQSHAELGDLRSHGAERAGLQRSEYSAIRPQAAQAQCHFP